MNQICEKINVGGMLELCNVLDFEVTRRRGEVRDDESNRQATGIQNCSSLHTLLDGKVSAAIAAAVGEIDILLGVSNRRQRHESTRDKRGARQRARNPRAKESGQHGALV